MAYQILTVDPTTVEDIEQLGSKRKSWFFRDGQRWLFKEARENTGEDWAEKVAAEIAPLIGVVAASVELAELQGRRGSATPSFLDESAGDALIHGNELLGGLVVGYKRDKRFRQSDHTLENIRSAMRNALPPESVDAVLTTLASYAVLDALIGNTDRHHENWGLIVRSSTSELRVAPSFDHASSLGRELTDDARERALAQDSVCRYLKAGRGGIYLNATDARGANPVDLVVFASQRYPEYFRPALQLVGTLNLATVRGIVAEVPDERISTPARQFATALVACALAELAKVRL